MLRNIDYYFITQEYLLQFLLITISTISYQAVGSSIGLIIKWPTLDGTYIIIYGL